MSFWEKILLLFKVKEPAEKLIDGIKGFKSGWKTVSFWVASIGSLTSIVAALNGILDVKTSLIITTGLGVVYNFLRGFEKADQNAIRPMLLSTEFWMGTAAMIGNALTTLKAGGVDPQWLVSAQSALAMAMAGAQSLAAQHPTPIPTDDEKVVPK